jgi:tRNA(fMet)-specific endonuclease VapC
MLRFMLDTNICIHVIKNRTTTLRERFNNFADRLCISIVTLAELIYGAEKSARPHQNLAVVEQFCARLEVLPLPNELRTTTVNFGPSSSGRANASAFTT